MGGYVCVDAERDKFPRIAWNRQNRSLFYGYGEYSCLHVIVMMIYISIRESIFFSEFLADQRPGTAVHCTFCISIIQSCIIFTENPLKGGYMDARSLHFTPLSKNGLDESSAKVWRASGWWKHFRLKHRVSEFTRRDHRRYFSQHRDPGRWLISYIFDSNASWISSPYFTFHALWMARSGYTNFHRSCNLSYELLR